VINLVIRPITVGRNKTNNDSSSIEKQDNQREVVNMQFVFYPKNIQILEDINNDVSSSDNNDGITEEHEIAKTKGKNDRKIKGKK